MELDIEKISKGPSIQPYPMYASIFICDYESSKC